MVLWKSRCTITGPASHREDSVSWHTLYDKSFQAGHMGLGHLRALMLLHEIGPCEIRFTAEVGRFHVLARIIR